MEDKFSVIKAKILHQTAREAQSSTSYKRVVGTLSGLGFLIAPDVKPLPSYKIDIEEAIAIGRSVEPRILEVLPAAIYSFPGSFLRLDKMPAELQEILSAFKTGKPGGSFEGISFDKLRDAAERPIKNRRRKVISERRIAKTYRLSPASIEMLRKKSESCGMNCTEYLEKLICAS